MTCEVVKGNNDAETPRLTKIILSGTPGLIDSRVSESHNSSLYKSLLSKMRKC